MTGTAGFLQRTNLKSSLALSLCFLRPVSAKLSPLFFHLARCIRAVTVPDAFLDLSRYVHFCLIVNNIPDQGFCPCKL